MCWIQIKIKWTQILRSPPVWAIILAKCGIAFGYMMINIKIPAYMEDQLNISLKDNGLLNASMYIILFFAQIASAPSSKYLIEKEILSPTIVRKIFESIGKFGVQNEQHSTNERTEILVVFSFDIACNRPVRYSFLG